MQTSCFLSPFRFLSGDCHIFECFLLSKSVMSNFFLTAVPLLIHNSYLYSEKFSTRIYPSFLFVFCVLLPFSVMGTLQCFRKELILEVRKAVGSHCIGGEIKSSVLNCVRRNCRGCSGCVDVCVIMRLEGNENSQDSRNVGRSSIKCFIPSLLNFITSVPWLHVSVFLQNHLQAVVNYREVHPVCAHTGCT